MEREVNCNFFFSILGIFDLINQDDALVGLETEKLVPIPALVIYGLTIRRLSLSKFFEG